MEATTVQKARKKPPVFAADIPVFVVHCESCDDFVASTILERKALDALDFHRFENSTHKLHITAHFSDRTIELVGIVSSETVVDL